MIAVALVLYVAATSVPVSASAAALVVTEIGVIVTWSSPAYVPNLLPRIAATAIVQAAAWATGFAVRTQRGYAAGLREQAERRVRAEADRSRRALAEERLRIARETHDVVAHSMGVIAVQAGAAGHVAAGRPEEAVKALRAIEETSRSARDLGLPHAGVVRGRGGRDPAAPSAGPGRRRFRPWRAGARSGAG